MSAEGELALVRATPDQYSEIARFKSLEGKTWNYPAIAGGRLLVRNASEMAAYNIAAQ
jgi:outer membrane protein assembly factor BamB